MRGTFPLGSILGIPIRMHILLCFLLGWMFVELRAETERAVLSIVIVLIAVLAHELGHAFAARRLGLAVRGVTLGFVSMTHLEIPEDGRTEALVALGGPCTNLALALVLWPAWAATGPSVEAPLWFASAHEVLFFGLAANLALGTLNLVPAFPADGGRVLRAVLARRLGWLRGTQIAYAVARLLAVVLFGIALASQQWLLALVAVWIWWQGALEMHAVRLRHAPDPLTLLREMFGRFAASKVRGSATRAFEAPWTSGKHVAPGDDHNREVDATRASRPAGIRDEDVERLEKFRGPLGKFRPP